MQRLWNGVKQRAEQLDAHCREWTGTQPKCNPDLTILGADYGLNSSTGAIPDPMALDLLFLGSAYPFSQ